MNDDERAPAPQSLGRAWTSGTHDRDQTRPQLRDSRAREHREPLPLASRLPAARGAHLSDVPDGPGGSPGKRRESPSQCPPGARSGVFPLPASAGNPGPAAAPGASLRRVGLGTPIADRRRLARGQPETPHRPSSIAGRWVAKRVPLVPPVVPVRVSAETRGRRQAGAGAVARHPGPHSPCPRRGPSPGPPLPRIASAPRRPPPPAAAAPGRGAGGGRRCPAGTDSRCCSRCRSRCVSGCGAGGVRRTRSAGQRRLHPAPVVAAGVKFQPPSPDRRGGHRHRDPDSHWHQDTKRHPDPHVVAPALRPAGALGPHRN